MQTKDAARSAPLQQGLRHPCRGFGRPRGKSSWGRSSALHNLFTASTKQWFASRSSIVLNIHQIRRGLASPVSFCSHLISWLLSSRRQRAGSRHGSGAIAVGGAARRGAVLLRRQNTTSPTARLFCSCLRVKSSTTCDQRTYCTVCAVVLVGVETVPADRLSLAPTRCNLECTMRLSARGFQGPHRCLQDAVPTAHRRQSRLIAVCGSLRSASRSQITDSSVQEQQPETHQTDPRHADESSCAELVRHIPPPPLLRATWYPAQFLLRPPTIGSV